MDMDWFESTSLLDYGHVTDTAVIYCWQIGADMSATGRWSQQIMTKKYGNMKHPREKAAAGRR